MSGRELMLQSIATGLSCTLTLFGPGMYEASAPPASPPKPLPTAPTSPPPADPQRPVAPDQSKIDPKAKEILDSARQRLADAKQFSVNIEHAFNMRGPDMRQEMESTYGLSLQRPNKLALKHNQGMMGETVIADGENLFTYWSSFNSYTKAPAPSSLQELFDRADAEPSFGSGPLNVIGPLMLTPQLPASLGTLQEVHAPEAAELNGEQMQRIRIVIKPSMATLPDEARVQLSHRDLQMPVEYWIKVEEQPQIARIRIDLTPIMRAMMAQMAEDSPEAAQLPDMRETEYEMITQFSEWKFDEEIPASRFAFDPPAGAKEVASMTDAMMGRQGVVDEESSGSSSAGAAGELRGKDAPLFSLPSIEGETVSLVQHRGKDIVILDFWATWCGPCVRAMPVLLEVANQYKDRNVVFYALNLREDEEKVRNFIEQKQWRGLRVLMDRKGDVAESYRVRGIPQTVIIDKDGTVQAVHVGFSNDGADQLRRELDSLIDGKKLASGE